MIFVASFILPAYRSEEPHNHSWYLSKEFIFGELIVCSIINGAGSALLLVQVGNYVSECASERNKGLYNSIFWCSLMVSGIVGNLMAAYVIVDVKESTFYMVMTGVCLASNLVFMLVPKPEKVIEMKPLPSKDLTIGNSVKISVVDMPPEEGSQAPGDWKQEIKDTLLLLKDPRMLELSLLVVWTAASNASIASVFIPFMTDTINNTPGARDWNDADKDKHCLLAMVGSGVGEIVGALIYAFI